MAKEYREFINRSDRVNLWSDIADRVSEIEGKKVSRQAVIATHQRMLKRLRILFSKDPYIRDWMIEHGIDPEQPEQ